MFPGVRKIFLEYNSYGFGRNYKTLYFCAEINHTTFNTNIRERIDSAYQLLFFKVCNKQQLLLLVASTSLLYLKASRYSSLFLPLFSVQLFYKRKLAN